jgi:cyclopropane fatty-acyl-phospholipid synthase-like methyltransferase
MAQYDEFADFYNRNWGEEYHLQIMGVLDSLLLNDLKSGDSILDIGCGTGTVAACLAERGFVVTGIDQSESMLDFARQNAPSAHFIQADARSFQLSSPRTASIATFEAMNHLLDRGDLEASFRCIAEATERCFVFDMNRESAFDLFWNGDFVVQQDGITALLTSTYDPISRLASCRTEVEGRITEIRERYYDTYDIERMLLQSGFKQIRRYDGKRDLGMTGNVSVGRFFYQCRR